MRSPCVYQTEESGRPFTLPPEKERKIIMKKRIASFPGGFLAALTLSACLTTALAASGKVSYNFANVALDGTQKITAGPGTSPPPTDKKVPAPSSTQKPRQDKTNLPSYHQRTAGTEIGMTPLPRRFLYAGEAAGVLTAVPMTQISKSQSWVADGWKATIERADGTVEEVPSFSDLFPGQELPTG